MLGSNSSITKKSLASRPTDKETSDFERCCWKEQKHTRRLEYLLELFHYDPHFLSSCEKILHCFCALHCGIILYFNNTLTKWLKITPPAWTHSRLLKISQYYTWYTRFSVWENHLMWTKATIFLDSCSALSTWKVVDQTSTTGSQKQQLPTSLRAAVAQEAAVRSPVPPVKVSFGEILICQIDPDPSECERVHDRPWILKCIE